MNPPSCEYILHKRGILIFFIMTAALFFASALFQPDKMLYSDESDIRFTFSSYSHAFADSVNSGNGILLWNKYAFAGYPFVANTISQMFYPAGAAFVVFGDYAFSLLFFIHVFLAGFLMFYLAQEFGIGRIGSLFAGVAYSFGGIFVMRIIGGHPVMAFSIAWIPLVFLLFMRLLKKPGLFESVLLGATLAMQFLAGHVQFFFYTMVALFLMWLFYEIPKRKKLLVPLPYLAFAGIVFLSLIAVQLLPFAEFLPHSERAGGMNTAAAAGMSLPPVQLASLAVPELFGTMLDGSYWGATNMYELCFYFGILPLFFGLLGLLLIRKNRNVLFLAVLALFSLLFSFGSYFFLFPALSSVIPFFNFFRVPARMMVFFVFSFALLAGFGLDNILARDKKFLKKIGLLLAILGIAALLCLAGAFVFKEKIIDAGSKLAEQKLAGATTYSNIVLDTYGAKYLVEKVFWHIIDNFVVITAVLLLAAAAFFAFIRTKITKQTLGLVLLFLLIFDLFSFGMKYVTVKDPNDIYAKNAVIDFLTKDTSQFRVLALNKTIEQGIFYRYGLESIGGFDSFRLQSYLDFTKFDWMENCSLTRPAGECITNMTALSLLNTKYIVSTTEITGHPELVQALKTEVTRQPYGITYKQPIYVYENIEVMPRVYYKETNSADSQKGTSIPEGITAEKYTPSEIILKTSKAGTIVLSEVYYPGWNVYIDGVKAEMIKEYGLLRAVNVDASEHTVRFVFEPTKYSIGYIVSFAAALGVAAFLFIKRKKYLAGIKPSEPAKKNK